MHVHLLPSHVHLQPGEWHRPQVAGISQLYQARMRWGRDLASFPPLTKSTGITRRHACVRPNALLYNSFFYWKLFVSLCNFIHCCHFRHTYVFITMIPYIASNYLWLLCKYNTKHNARPNRLSLPRLG